MWTFPFYRVPEQGIHSRVVDSPHRVSLTIDDLENVFNDRCVIRHRLRNLAQQRVAWRETGKYRGNLREITRLFDKKIPWNRAPLKKSRKPSRHFETKSRKISQHSGENLVKKRGISVILYDVVYESTEMATCQRITGNNLVSGLPCIDRRQ